MNIPLGFKMKFESKFGLGEIVHNTLRGHKKAEHDDYLEVINVGFSKVGVVYSCRYPSGIIAHFSEYDLTGDPDFNQEKGCYDYDLKEN